MTQPEKSDSDPYGRKQVHGIAKIIGEKGSPWRSTLTTIGLPLAAGVVVWWLTGKKR